MDGQQSPPQQQQGLAGLGALFSAMQAMQGQPQQPQQQPQAQHAQQPQQEQSSNGAGLFFSQPSAIPVAVPVSSVSSSSSSSSSSQGNSNSSNQGNNNRPGFFQVGSDDAAAELLRPENLGAQVRAMNTPFFKDAINGKKSGIGLLGSMFRSDKETGLSTAEVLMGKTKADAEQVPDSLWEYTKGKHTVLSMWFVDPEDPYTRKRRLMTLLSGTIFNLLLSTSFSSMAEDPVPVGIQVLLAFIIGGLKWGYCKVNDWLWEVGSHRSFMSMIVNRWLKWRFVSDLMQLLITIIIWAAVGRNVGSFILQWFASEVCGWGMEFLWIPVSFFFATQKQNDAAARSSSSSSLPPSSDDTLTTKLLAEGDSEDPR